MNRTIRLLAIFNTLLTAALLLGFFQFAPKFAIAKPTAIFACADKNTGALRVAYKSCTYKENYVTWGVTSASSTTGLSICKSKKTEVIALRVTCTSKESKVSNNKQLIGKTGTPGKNGIDGAAGQNGVTGLPGLQGAMGSVGTAGAAGSGGVKGETGSNGAGGATGSIGASGTNGNDGTTGTNGTNGAAGTNGNDGTAGADGSNGVDGAPGRNGIDGDDGATGPKGETGGGGIADDECLVTILDTDGKPAEMKGIFAWVLTAPESEMYVLGCDTNMEKQIVTNRPR
jgi:hypothetical protein